VSDEWSDGGAEQPAQDDTAPEPFDDAPPKWRAPDPTGVQAVDDAMAELAALDLLPTSEHVAVFDVVHRKLQDALADLDGA
jgi:hypothetical protein